jgi:hypothetical protein
MFDEKCWGSSDVFIGNLLHENLVIEKIILLIRQKNGYEVRKTRKFGNNSRILKYEIVTRKCGC